MATVVNGEGLTKRLRREWEKKPPHRAAAFLCVGTDRSTGDAFGPLVGTMLEEAGYPYVVGTLAHPCDSSNLIQRLTELPEDATVFAIDCCVGSSVGMFQVEPYPLKPGKFMGKPLPDVGETRILGTVCRNEDNPYKALQTASLYLVMKMAKQTAEAIQAAIPLR